MVPEEIRKIERPKNTIVQATKKENVYLVVQRIGCKYDNGRRLPVNGKVIGHIIIVVFIEVSKATFHALKLIRQKRVQRDNYRFRNVSVFMVEISGIEPLTS